MSQLSVITRTDDDLQSGTMLEYDAEGAISSQRSVARERGTTVVLKKLFHSLPGEGESFAVCYDFP